MYVNLVSMIDVRGTVVPTALFLELIVAANR